MSGFSNLNETMAVQEAAAAGLNSMAHLIEAFSNHHQQTPCQNQKPDCREITNFTVSKFKRVISLLDRTGHARFRRGPVQPRQHSQALTPALHQNPPLRLFSPPASAAASPYGLTQRLNLASKIYRPQPQSLLSLSPASLAAHAPVATQPMRFGSDKPGAAFKKYGSVPATVMTENKSATTCRSSVTGERSVSKRRGRLPMMCAGLSAQPVSARKPPLPGRRNREDDRSDDAQGQTPGSRPCKSKRRIRKIIKVPAISTNNKDIPPDQYSWRKYGEREIKGSPYPRCYYKCRMTKDWACPARKYVERDIDDPRMLFVIYEGEHCHNQGEGPDDSDPMVVID